MARGGSDKDGNRRHIIGTFARRTNNSRWQENVLRLQLGRVRGASGAARPMLARLALVHAHWMPQTPCSHGASKRLRGQMIMVADCLSRIRNREKFERVEEKLLCTQFTSVREKVQ